MRFKRSIGEARFWRVGVHGESCFVMRVGIVHAHHAIAEV